MKTTIDTITDEQIRALMTAAGSAGDKEMVEICKLALDGEDAERAICVDVIRDAEAQADT